MSGVILCRTWLTCIWRTHDCSAHHMTGFPSVRMHDLVGHWQHKLAKQTRRMPAVLAVAVCQLPIANLHSAASGWSWPATGWLLTWPLSHASPPAWLQRLQLLQSFVPSRLLHCTRYSDHVSPFMVREMQDCIHLEMNYACGHVVTTDNMLRITMLSWRPRVLSSATGIKLLWFCIRDPRTRVTMLA